MDPKLQTSFIPKKALTGGGSVSSGISIVSLIASIIFVMALVASIGLFFFSHSLDSQIQTSTDTLKREEDAFDPNTIENLVRLDARIEATKQILHNHIAITPLFATLEQTILRSIRFSNLTFSYGGPDKVMLSMDGQALSYASIAYQSDTITQNSKLIRNPVFSDLGLDESGNITFKFSATLNPILISYENNFSAMQTSMTNTPASPPSATPAPTAGVTIQQ